jgi:hypothetical protein
MNGRGIGASNSLSSVRRTSVNIHPTSFLGDDEDSTFPPLSTERRPPVQDRLKNVSDGNDWWTLPILQKKVPPKKHAPFSLDEAERKTLPKKHAPLSQSEHVSRSVVPKKHAPFSQSEKRQSELNGRGIRSSKSMPIGPPRMNGTGSVAPAPSRDVVEFRNYLKDDSVKPTDISQNLMVPARYR